MKVLLALILVPSISLAEAFSYDFASGLNGEWTASSWTAPRGSDSHRTFFSPSHVAVVNGVLQLKLSQTKNPDGSLTSIGGEIKSNRKFGYGTYEFELKASSVGDKTVSGSVTGAYIYLKSSETEIDIEMEGAPSRAQLTQTSSWVHENAAFENSKMQSKHPAFHVYKIIWEPKRIQFFENGKRIAVHSRVIPHKPGFFMFNHWGTNSNEWGGKATVGVERFVHIKRFSFTPAKKNQPV